MQPSRPLSEPTEHDNLCGMDFSQFPEPHPSVAGDRHTENRPGLIARLARLWRPQGAKEQELSTLSRFAGRVIDRTTGRAYSADELVDFIKGGSQGFKLRSSAVNGYQEAFTVEWNGSPTAYIAANGEASFSGRLIINADTGASVILMRNHLGTYYELSVDGTGELQIQESA